jgi:hypothetical protein
MFTTLTDVRRANQIWFGKGQARFFGDASYKLLTAKSGQKYLVRLSSAWSDMLGSPKTFKYFLNPIRQDDLHIESLINRANGLPLSFDTIDDVKDWLKEN